MYFCAVKYLFRDDNIYMYRYMHMKYMCLLQKILCVYSSCSMCGISGPLFCLAT